MRNSRFYRNKSTPLAVQLLNVIKLLDDGDDDDGDDLKVAVLNLPIQQHHHMITRIHKRPKKELWLK